MNGEPAAAAQGIEPQIVAAIQELPTLPAVATRLLALISDPTSSIKEICGLIQSDASLTARILRIVNSSYYGLPRRIDTVSMATVMLGTAEIAALAVGSSALAVLRGTGRKDAAADAFWRHNLCCATAADDLGRRFPAREPGVAFVAGLLHDSGKLVLMQSFRSEYAEVGRLTDGGIGSLEAEQAVFSTDHERVGRALAQAWRLPPALAEAMSHHHTPEQAIAQQALVLDLVHLADLCAHRLVQDRPGKGPDLVGPVTADRLRRLRADLDASDLDRLVPETAAALKRSAHLDVLLECV